MNRFDKLKRLKDEINRLFHSGIDENAVVNQLHADEQFSDFSHGQVQAFYSHFQQKFNTEAEDKHEIAVFEHQIADHQQQIAEENQQGIFWSIFNFFSNRHQTLKTFEHERELIKKQRMKAEIESMVKYKQNSNKFLIYGDEFFVRLFDIKYFWQGRFSMTLTSGKIHIINVQDLLQDTTKLFKIQKVDRPYAIYALKFPFLLLHEYDIINRVAYLRLVKIDFENESLQVVQSFDFNGRCQVLVNASDSSKFLLRKGKDVNECNLIGDKILIGKKHAALETHFNFDYGSYFDEQFCSLQFEYSRNYQVGIFQLTQAKMLLYDLERNKPSTQDLNSTPENFHCLAPYDLNYSAWIRDTVFVTIQFLLNGMYGVLFTNSQVRSWKCVDFATDLRISHIQSFVDNTLLIYSGERQNKRKIYKLQMRKPDFLRYMAWTAIVKLFKEAKINNPYEEARQYLPLNSEIQPFTFTED